ncbi:MAG: hypothetical protein H6600_02245 [Flavobacteriales bacterium]|nr:hypothetical protein [Flavobacteriales bacterium]
MTEGKVTNEIKELIAQEFLAEEQAIKLSQWFFSIKSFRHKESQKIIGVQRAVPFIEEGKIKVRITMNEGVKMSGKALLSHSVDHYQFFDWFELV